MRVQISALTVDTTGAASVISGVTYGGVALTKIGTGIQVPADRWLNVWFLAAPAIGSNNVVVSSSTSTYMSGMSASYTGAKQTGIPDAQVKTSGTSTTASGTLTTVAANVWLATSMKWKPTATASAGTNTVQRQNARQIFLGDTNGPLATPGSYTATVNLSASVGWAEIVVSIAPFGNSVPTITSANSTTFTEGVAGNFSVTTTGSPTPSITETGTLPSGVTFTDNGNGTGTLSGTPGGGSAGSYAITFTATNTGGSANQNFTLTVNPPSVTLNWQVSNLFDIYRGSGTCPAASYTKIASGVNALTYTDNSVTGGQTYCYYIAVTPPGTTTTTQVTVP